MRICALFAGIAGLELGLENSGHNTLLFCEIDASARAVLAHHYPDVPIHPDVQTLANLPQDTEIVTAGFPCQDLSQAGRTEGINGSKSGVIAHLFRLLRTSDIPNALIENVPFMLQLEGGQAIRYLVDHLEDLGYNWAYRVIDARAFGLPQRRERVFLLASKHFEPWRVMFEDESLPCIPSYRPRLACGFYWTEGTRGLGWAVDAVPTLKGGSTLGIPSPPAVWMPDGRILKPSITDAERLQGFPVDWSRPAESVAKKGYRWKLVGNAVSVRASTWIGACISRLPVAASIPLTPYSYSQDRMWPSAAFGTKTHERSAVEISKWPCACTGPHLAEFLSPEADDLSLRATSGFIGRLTRSSLRYPKDFLDALLAHQDRMRGIQQRC